MCSLEIKRLVEFLQNNGGGVINGRENFSLTPAMLKEINKALLTIKENLYVGSMGNNSVVLPQDDLKFLYEFIKKTPKLKISQTMSSQNFPIDISDFTNISYLELYKVNVKLLKGIQFMKDNLEMLVCTRCLEKIGDLLLKTELDNGSNLIWSKLRHSVLSRNALTSLDDSFIYTPWLQYLDISFNHLTDLRPLASLRNLTYLNASFNNLTCVPVLSEYANSRLKVLLLSNNQISDISGLRNMENVRQCDLSGNCISHHDDLHSLSYLYSLVSIDLSGNPISYHEAHRSLVCKYLHENTANEHFQLNNVLLNKIERDAIKERSTESATYAATSSQASSNIFNYLHSTPPSSPTNRVVESPLDTQIVSSSTRKKIREAIISEQITDIGSIVQLDAPIIPDESPNNISGTSEHLETKKQIEILREKFGEDNWLHSKAGSYVQDLLGIEKQATQESSSFNEATFISDAFNSKTELDITKVIGENSIEIVSENEEDGTQQSQEENDSVDQFSDENEKEEEEEEEEEGSVDTEETLWLVTKVNVDVKQDVFIVLNDVELKELDVPSGRVMFRWPVDTIERCIKVSTKPLTVALLFNCAKRSERNRKYIMEFADAQKLMEKVQEEMESRPFSAFNQLVLHCIKCYSVFCQERRSYFMKEDNITCPTCGSTAVIEADESIVANKSNDNNNKTANANANESKLILSQSPSLSSIGSSGSLDIINERSCQDSDVEIMSNPSESSVEVLEVHGNSVENKEEPTRVRNNSTNNQGLTESSSSGSMTDSICTTYETRGPQRISQSTIDETLHEEASMEPSPTKEEKNILQSNASTNYTSLLENLIYSVKSRLGPKAVIANTSSNDLLPDASFSYSYDDFTNVDHRLKLYFYQQIFEQDEHIVALLRAEGIFKTGQLQPYVGLLLISTFKLYFFRIIGHVSENNPEEWLQKIESYNSDKLKLVQGLLWKQGVSIDVLERPSYPAVTFIALLCDRIRTDNFLSFVRDQGMFHVNKTEPECYENIFSNLLSSDDTVKTFVISKSISIYDHEEETNSFDLAGILITGTEIILLDGVGWMLSNTSPSAIFNEKICNLVDIGKSEQRLFLQFTDEMENESGSWRIRVATEESVNDVIEAIREPWEQIFSIQLQIST